MGFHNERVEEVQNEFTVENRVIPDGTRGINFKVRRL